MTSIPGSGHNCPPRDWLDVLRALIRKLKGWYAEAVRRAVQFLTAESLVRRVDKQLADDLAQVERLPSLNDEERRALARTASAIRIAAK